VRFFKNQDFDFGLSIVLSAAATRQSGAGECLAIAGRINYNSTATYTIAGSKRSDEFERVWSEHRDCWGRAGPQCAGPVAITGATSTNLGRVASLGLHLVGPWTARPAIADCPIALWYVFCCCVLQPRTKGQAAFGNHTVRRGALFRLTRGARHCAVLAGVLAAGAVGAAPAGAAGIRNVTCRGNSDGCVASLSIAGGATNQTVRVVLNDTDYVRAGRRVINLPGSPRGKVSMKNGRFSLGGSVFTFTLNAAKSNPRGSRLILLFAAGRPF
jgi:hypothetical protein